MDFSAEILDFEGIDPQEFAENHDEIRQALKKVMPKDKLFFHCQSCRMSVGQQCSGCKIGQFYCSNECQQVDWKKHKENCGRRYKCAEVPKKGLGNLATRNIAKGEIICVEKPALLIDTFEDTNTVDIYECERVYNKNL